MMTEYSASYLLRGSATSAQFEDENSDVFRLEGSSSSSSPLIKYIIRARAVRVRFEYTVVKPGKIEWEGFCSTLGEAKPSRPEFHGVSRATNRVLAQDTMMMMHTICIRSRGDLSRPEHILRWNSRWSAFISTGITD